MRAAARLSGYTELESPSVEPLDLFTTKSGEEITSQLWAFQDKGGREVALVAETTPSLARIYAERAKAEPLPVKWFTVSKLWRYEEPQAGRTREFSQFNVDILGVPGVEAEVDILATSAAMLDAAGAKDLYAFRLNDRALAEGIGQHFGAKDRDLYFRAVDRFRKSTSAELEAGLVASGISSGSVSELEELLFTGTNGVEAAHAEELFRRLEALGLSGGPTPVWNACGPSSVWPGPLASIRSCGSTLQWAVGSPTTPPPSSRRSTAQGNRGRSSVGAATTI